MLSYNYSHISHIKSLFPMSVLDDMVFILDKSLTTMKDQIVDIVLQKNNGIAT